MKFFTTRKKLAATAASVALAASLGGVAYAYFTSTGTGTGHAATGSVAALQFGVTVADTSSTALLPTPLGDSNASVDTQTITVVNNTESDLNVNQIVLKVDPAFTHTVAGDPACTGADYSINGATAGSSVTLTPNALLSPNSDNAPADTYTTTFTVQLVENNANQDSCQGQSVPVIASVS